MKPTATYITSMATNTAGTDSCGATATNAMKPTAMPPKPRGSKGHSPRLSMMRPPSSVAPAFASTGTRITRPAAKAVMPAAPSKYSGSSTLIENMLIIAMVTRMIAGQNARFFIGAKSMSGCAHRSWRTTNTATMAAASTRAATARTPSVVSCVKPNDNTVSATAERTTDSTSRCASCVSRFFM